MQRLRSLVGAIADPSAVGLIAACVGLWLEFGAGVALTVVGLVSFVASEVAG
jgi:hypothetical protein